ncbi:hypothetical protein QJS66_08950 [Kocuria rhizophila]|nr:hypothetical protein QJS66_08950 [Kocuria rhizophila]
MHPDPRKSSTCAGTTPWRVRSSVPARRSSSSWTWTRRCSSRSVPNSAWTGRPPCGRSHSRRRCWSRTAPAARCSTRSQAHRGRYRMSRRQLEDLTKIGPPPIVALLALPSLAGRHMSALAARTGKKSVSTFYLPLAVLLQAGQDNAKALESSVRKDGDLLGRPALLARGLRLGSWGCPPPTPVNHRPVGLALSQTLLAPRSLPARRTRCSRTWSSPRRRA